MVAQFDPAHVRLRIGENELGLVDGAERVETHFRTLPPHGGMRQDTATWYWAPSRAGKRLGLAYRTYVRVDFLVTETKVVFGEFATTPGGGRGFTPFADEYLGGLWQGAFPGET